MKKGFALPVLISIALLVPSAVLAQGKTARLLGYEKAEYVAGIFSVNAGGNSVMIAGLKTVYDKPLEIYVTRSFDPDESFKVGEVAAGKAGDMFFDIPALDISGFDSVLLMVPDWTTPVGVGLLE